LALKRQRQVDKPLHGNPHLRLQWDLVEHGLAHLYEQVRVTREQVTQPLNKRMRTAAQDLRMLYD
jgi:hypothetical protein